MKKMIVLIMVAFVLFGCVDQQDSENYEQFIYQPSVIYVDNTTVDQNLTQNDTINKTYVPPIQNYTTLTFNYSKIILNNYMLSNQTNQTNVVSTWHSNKFAAIYAYDNPITFISQFNQKVMPWDILIKDNFYIKKCKLYSTMCPEIDNEKLQNLTNCNVFYPKNDSCGIAFYPGTYHVIIKGAYVGDVVVEY